MNATRKQLFGKIAIFAIAGTMVVGQAVGLTKPKRVSASAESAQEEIIYCDDLIYGNDVFNGQGAMTNHAYDIYCDEMVTVSSAVHPSAPSFTSYEPGMTNYCGAMAGRNVVVFYDRWLTNLVPGYDPGMVSASGIYRYFPDMDLPATDAVMASLYDLMHIGQVGGTTSQNFKNGLISYASEKGYDVSYSSFYSNSVAVNLSQLTTAINQNKIGVVMCSQYNFIYNIVQYEEQGFTHISKFQSTTAHMMMVYGYKTIAFYQNDTHVCTKTFLRVCSGFEDGEFGYMEMNDFATINEAVIVSMS